MGDITTLSGKEDFSKAALVGDALKHRLAEHQRRELARIGRDRKARRDDARDQDDDLAVAQTAVLATTGQIAAFRTELDTYDSAIVEALMENEEALRIARQARDDSIMHAHVLPDGRRVFRTEDGQRVIDEHGQDVTDEIAPEEIDPSLTHWEDYQATVQGVQDLEAERQDLLDFQQRVDETRQRLDDGGLTADDLDDMRAELEADMPDAVRARIDPDAPAPDRPDPTDPAPTGQPLDLDAMRQGLAAATSGL